MWYLLCFLGRNERNKCGGVPKWLYMIGNLRKRKVDCSKRPSEKKKKWSWKKKEKMKRKNTSENWVSLYKVSGLNVIKKKKQLCSTSL